MERLQILKRKHVILFSVLIVLLIILAAMSVYALRGKGDYFFLILGAIHLYFAISYIRSFISSYTALEFTPDKIIFVKGKQRDERAYTAVRLIVEKPWGYVEVVLDGKESLLLHGESPGGRKEGDERRLSNIIRAEITSRSGESIPVQYRSR